MPRAARAIATNVAPRDRGANRRRLEHPASMGPTSRRVGFEAPVANARVIGGGEVVDDGALPYLLQIGRELEPVRVAHGEAADLAPDEVLHLVLDLPASLPRLVVSDQDG